jgi:hypothetical protein
MAAHVTRLETHMEYVREDLAQIKDGQRDMTRTLAETSKALGDLFSKVEKLPTKDDLWSWKVQWLAIALGTVAFIVGGIIGGLDWIKTR